MAAGFSPTCSVTEAAQQLGAHSTGAALLSALCAEPGTGVALVSSKLRILWANDQVMRIFLGPDATAAQYVGVYCADIFPREWVKERVAHYEHAIKTRRPFLLRSVWRDFQHFSWHYPLGALDDEQAEIFLVITRRIASDVDVAEVYPPGDFDEHDSHSMRLLSLDALSPRELQVLALFGQGLSATETAARLELSEKTIDNHRASIYSKLGLNDRSELLTVARRAGLCMADANRRRV